MKAPISYMAELLNEEHPFKVNRRLIERIATLEAQVKDQVDRLKLAKAEANLDDAVIKALEAQNRQLREAEAMSHDGLKMIANLTMVSALSARAHILMEAAQSICGYCHGTSGHESHPVKQYGQWDHLFMVGNGSNPCAAGAIWNMIEKCCLDMGSQYTPWKKAP